MTTKCEEGEKSSILDLATLFSQKNVVCRFKSQSHRQQQKSVNEKNQSSVRFKIISETKILKSPFRQHHHGHHGVDLQKVGHQLF